MASPAAEVFYLFDDLTGLPLSGKTIGPGASEIHFLTYVNPSGVAIAQPTITEVGGGGYRFTPDFTVANANTGICYVISTGGESPPYIANYCRPEEQVITGFETMATTISSIYTSLSTTISSKISWLYDLFHGF